MEGGPGVPAVIHQTWRTARAPGRLRKAMGACRALHPHYAYRYYDDDALRDQVAAATPGRLAFYDSLASGRDRAAFATYAILWAQGGVFLHTDLACTGCLDPLLADLPPGTAAAASEPDDTAAAFGLQPATMVSLAAVASPAGHPLWPAVMDWIQAHHPRVLGDNPEEAATYNTGARALGAFLATRPDLGASLALWAPATFLKGGYGVHKHASSWKTPTKAQVQTRVVLAVVIALCALCLALAVAALVVNHSQGSSTCKPADLRRGSDLSLSL